MPIPITAQTPNPTGGAYAFPYDARIWGQLGLPTLRETANAGYTLGTAIPNNGRPSGAHPAVYGPRLLDEPLSLDRLRGSGHRNPIDLFQTASDTRLTDDVVMTNVVGFDVKAWDPVAGLSIPFRQWNRYYGDAGRSVLWHGVD